MVVNYYDVMVKILWVGGIIFIPTEDKNNSAEGRTCKPEGGIIPTIPTGKSHPGYANTSLINTHVPALSNRTRLPDYFNGVITKT